MSNKKASPLSLTRVAAVGILGVGIYIGSKMQSFGPGGEQASTEANTEAVSADIPESGPPPEQPPEPPLPTLGPPSMISVLIREDGFVVTRAGEEGSLAMALPEIADLAAATTGTPEGIRVRIQRHVTAQAGDQQRLYQALADVGIKPEQMQQLSEFVE